MLGLLLSKHRRERDNPIITGFARDLMKELTGLVIRDYLRDKPLRSKPFNDGIPGRDSPF